MAESIKGSVKAQSKTESETPVEKKIEFCGDSFSYGEIKIFCKCGKNAYVNLSEFDFGDLAAAYRTDELVTRIVSDAYFLLAIDPWNDIKIAEITPSELIRLAGIKEKSKYTTQLLTDGESDKRINKNLSRSQMFNGNEHGMPAPTVRETIAAWSLTRKINTYMGGDLTKTDLEAGVTQIGFYRRRYTTGQVTEERKSRQTSVLELVLTKDFKPAIIENDPRSRR